MKAEMYRERAQAAGRRMTRLGRRLAVQLQYHSDPAFLIIGAQKSSTSWLHRQLEQHPQTFSARGKEVHFFDQDKAFSRGVAWYREQFPMPQRGPWPCRIRSNPAVPVLPRRYRGGFTRTTLIFALS